MHTATGAPRHDIYAFIHKGLRAFMSHALVRVGRLDANDPAEVAEVGAELAALLEVCSDHLEHENDVIHPAMEARQPSSSHARHLEHGQHREAIDGLRQLLARLPDDPLAADTLYRALGTFVAHNFDHMAWEETAHNAVLWATHSDDEIRALEHRITSGLSPEQSALALRWMLPHMNPAERAAMLARLRQGAPTEVFDGVLSLIRPLLGGPEWRKLSAALGL